MKLLFALAAGIMTQYYFEPGIEPWLILITLPVLLLLSFFGFSQFRKYRWSFYSGVAALVLFYSLGGLLTLKRDITKDPRWFGNNVQKPGFLLAVAEEPAVEKANSYKFAASVILFFTEGKTIPVRGKIFVYLKKSAVSRAGDIPGYGTQLILKNDLKPITGFGNPGGFDYGRYCRLKGITHQVFPGSNDHIILGEKRKNFFTDKIHQLRGNILKIIRAFIPGEKECGLAEALLIGYKLDLDKSLVRSYSDTGVVHIIAISGLHIGLIYWLLSVIFKPLKKAGLGRFASLLTIGGLWIFSFLAGAQPSILRAAVMFSCIILADEVAGKNSIYNTIAFSAFLLLCIDPFWLWDAGFQLSYAAVVGIIGFMKPVYGLLYFKNRLLDLFWKMNTVTLAAQVFTLPLCLYYFHQFPNFFLVTNLVAVPLSSVILFGEILLMAFSFFPLAAAQIGWVLNLLLKWMNKFVTTMASLPFATWESIQISTWQVMALLMFASAFCYGITERSRSLLRFSAFGVLIFFFLRYLSFDRAARQELIIVYNVPRQTAIDLVIGRSFDFIGDSTLRLNSPEKELYLDPSRCYFRSFSRKSYDPSQVGLLAFCNKKIWRIDRDLKPAEIPERSQLDLLILSKNPRIYLHHLAERIRIRRVVIDPSVPKWKAELWKKDCDSLSIPCHVVSTDGAFVMTIR